MSISTVQQAFEEFERTSVRVADVENRAAKRVQAEFREAVQKALGAWYADSFWLARTGARLRRST